MSPDAALLTFVARCQRRVRLLLLVQYFVLGLAAACLICALVLISGIERALAWSAVATAVAIAASTVAAFRHTPSAIRVAADVDRQLRLKNTVVAAIQLRQSGLVVAPLIVRDAAACVSRIVPASVFPFELRWRNGLLAVSALLLLAILTMLDAPGTPLVSPQTPLTSSGEGPSATGSTPARPGQAATVRSGGQPASGEAQPVGNQENSNIGQSVADPSTALTSRTNGATPSDAVGGPALRTQPFVVPPGPAQMDSSAADASTAGGRPAAGQGVASAGTDGAVTAGAGAAGIGRGEGAGGVRGQAIGAAVPRMTNTVPARPPTTDEYARARQRANAALARDQIPPDLRAYVHDYFVAIAPAESR